MLRIFLFGRLQTVEGETVLLAPTPTKVLDLWVYLLIHRDHPTRRDLLAFSLWPDEPEIIALANLRRRLYLLRRYLPKPVRKNRWIISNRTTLQWNPDSDYWLDIEEFQKHLSAGESGEVLNQLQSAVDLYLDDLLPVDHSYWVLLERERLRQLYMSAAERLIALQEETGNLQAALATARQLLVHDSLSEAAHRLVMRLYYLVGNRAAALRQFETCRRLLREELDVELMPETIALRQTILEGSLANAEKPTAPTTTPQPAPFSQKETAESPSPERATPIKPASRTSRKQVVWGALILLVSVLMTFAFLITKGTYSPRPALPSRTVTFSGPDVVSDTWITAEYPDIDYWPEGPEFGTYDSYVQVHLQYYEQSLDRFLIRFDLGNIPPGIDVQEAIFELHLETWTAEVGSGRNVLSRAYPATVSAYQIYRPWPGKGTTYIEPWSQPGLEPGSDFRAEPLNNQVITDTTWLHLDVTEAVRTWLNRPQENQGLMLKISDAPENFAHYWVYTTDSMDAGLRPKLTITYSPPKNADEQVLILSGDKITDTGIHSSFRLQPVEEQAAFIELDKGRKYAKGLLFFNLDSLPQAAQITAAELVVYLEPGPFDAIEAATAFPATALPATIAVHQLYTAWQSGTVTFDFPWSQPGLSPGIDYDPVPLDTQPIRAATYLTFDVTTAVLAWQTGENNGLLVSTHEAQEGFAPYHMHTSESPIPAYRPHLIIYYH